MRAFERFALTDNPASLSAVDRIDVHDDAALNHWAPKLDTTRQQLIDAVAAVGDVAGDVEMHLKGSRSTTNADLVEEVIDSEPVISTSTPPTMHPSKPHAGKAT